MKNKIYITLLVACFAVCVFFKIKSGNNEMAATKWKARYDRLAAAYNIIKNKEGKQVIEQRPAVFTNDDVLKEASAKVFNLSKKEERKVKEVKAFAQIAQAALITKDSAQATPADDSTYRFAINKKEYSITGHMRKEWLYIDSLAIYNTLSIRLAEKRKGLFKRELVIQAVNNNPYINNTAITSMVVQQKPTAWNRWIKPALFAAGGYVMGRAIK